MTTPSAQSRLKQSLAPEHARARLVDAAIDLFGRNSFDGVSTRTLAQRAKVNLAAIQYYFGSKEGLYLAVARRINERIRSEVAPALAEMEGVLNARVPSREECFTMVCRLMEVMIATTLESPDSMKWVGILVREQIEPSPAFDILFEGVMRPTHECLCRLVAGILGTDPQAAETKIRVYTIMGQVIMFHVSRAAVARTLGWETYRPEQVASIKSVVLESVRALLGMNDARVV